MGSATAILKPFSDEEADLDLAVARAIESAFEEEDAEGADVDLVEVIKEAQDASYARQA